MPRIRANAASPHEAHSLFNEVVVIFNELFNKNSTIAEGYSYEAATEVSSRNFFKTL